MARQTPHRTAAKFVTVGVLGVLALVALLLSAEQAPSSVPTATTLNNANCADFVLLAEKDVAISHAVASDGNIHANDDIMFSTGSPSTHTGNLTAVDNITIGKANTIEGDATAGGKINISTKSVITGATTEHTAVTPLALPTLSFSSGGQNIAVPANSSLALDPGLYGKVEVKSRGTLLLRAGEYFMKSLAAWGMSTISVDVSEGPVTVNVTDELEFGRHTEVVITPSGELGTRDVTFNSMQTGKLNLLRGARVLGTILAPHAKVEAMQEVNFKGSICAKDIEIGRGATLGHHSPISQVSIDALTIPFSYPPDWTASQEELNRNTLLSPTSIPEVDAGSLVTPPDIVVSLHDNPSNLNLSNFMNGFQDGWFTAYEQITPTAINGHGAIIVSDLNSDIAHSPIIAAFLAVNTKILVVTSHGVETQQEFEDILASLQLP